MKKGTLQNKLKVRNVADDPFPLSRCDLLAQLMQCSSTFLNLQACLSVFFLVGWLVFEGNVYFNMISLVVFLRLTTKQYQMVTFVLYLTVCIVAHLKIQAIDGACEVLVLILVLIHRQK